MSRRRKLVVAVGLAAVAVGVAIGLYVHEREQPVSKRGSATEEFVAVEPKPVRPREPARPWPTYAFDGARRHVSPYRHRRPGRLLWHFDALDTLEFPPTVGYGRVFLAQQKGRFYALDARTGRRLWRKDTRRCSASSPTLGDGVVYQSWMDWVPCPEARPGATGYLVAWDARTGRRRWRFDTAPIESSPLLVRGTLYFGAWDRRVHAVDARTGRERWSFAADDEVNTSAAHWRGTIYIASDAGTLFALDARNGRLRWSAQSHAGLRGREFFYATPTVAYGRVYIGNTDGTMYVYGATSGNLLWARPLGTYVYSGAAVWRRTVYTGTYDGSLYALDAATGDVRWQRSAAGAIHGSPTVMNGLVYYSTCSSCGSAASRAVKRGPDGTYAVDARTGKPRWSFRDGKYASALVADPHRIYITGRALQYAFAPTRPARHRPRR